MKDTKLTVDETLWDMEERFWTQGADNARTMSAKNAVFVFPYPVGILSGSAVWREADVAQRWRSVDMSDRYISVEEAVAVLAYRVAAERGDEPVYTALCTSTYLRDEDRWLRLTHQQSAIN